MADTFCGKSCDQCSYKRSLSCPGCQAGPGNGDTGDCAIARCCRTSRRDSCASCSIQDRCSNLRSREYAAKDRLRKQTEEQAAREEFIARGSYLRKFIWILLVLTIPHGIGAVLSGDAGLLLVPSVQTAARAASLVIRLLLGILLLIMGSREPGYRTAGWFFLASSILGTMSGLLPFIACILLLLAGEYRLYSAHESIMDDRNEKLARWWGNIWKWRALVCADTIGTAVVRATSALPAMFGMAVILVYATYLAGMALGYILVLCQMWEQRRGPSSRTVVVFHGKLPIRLIHADYFGTVFAVVVLTALGLIKYVTILISLLTAVLIPVLLLGTAKALPRETDF